MKEVPGAGVGRRTVVVSVAGVVEILVVGADDPCSQCAQEGGIDRRSNTAGGYNGIGFTQLSGYSELIAELIGESPLVECPLAY